MCKLFVLDQSTCYYIIVLKQIIAINKYTRAIQKIDWNGKSKT